MSELEILYNTTNEYTVSFVKEQYPVDIVKITSNNDASVLTLNIINRIQIIYIECL